MPLKKLAIPQGNWQVSYRFERVGAALAAGLLPLSRFDALPEMDKVEIIEYLREKSMMEAWEMQQREAEMNRTVVRGKR